MLGRGQPASALHGLTGGHCSWWVTTSLVWSLSLGRRSFVLSLCLPTLERQHILPRPSGRIMTQMLFDFRCWGRRAMAGILQRPPSLGLPLGVVVGRAGMTLGPVSGSAGLSGRDLNCSHVISQTARLAQGVVETQRVSTTRRQCHCRHRAENFMSICWFNLHSDPLRWVR